MNQVRDTEIILLFSYAQYQSSLVKYTGRMMLVKQVIN